MPDCRSVGYGLAFALFWLGLALVLVLAVWNMFRKSDVRVRLQLIGLALLGTGLLTLAVLNLFAIYKSNLLTVQGSIQHLYQSHGKGHTSYFYLQSNGYTKSLMTNYDGRQLYDGQQVSATYLSETGTVVDLKVLDGPDAGWTLHEGSGVAISIFEICLGGFLVLIGLPRHLKQKKTKRAVPRA